MRPMRPMRPEDINRFVSPGYPQISPDGRRLVYVVQTPDAEEDRNRTDLWITAAAGGQEPVRLTNAGGKDRLPRWSPDGKTIAFVSERNGRPQIWLIAPDGGEARHLPTDQAVASAPEWSPDGRFIAYTARIFERPADWQPYPGAPPGDRERAAAQAAEDGKGPKTGKRDVSEVKVITRLKYRFDGAGYFGDRRSHVFVVGVPCAGPGASGVAAAGGTDATDPSRARMVTSGDYDHEAPAWTPDGKLVFTAVRRGDADSLANQDLWLADPATGALTLLYEGRGPAGAARVSLDGSMVAFLGHDNRYRGSTTPSLLVIPLAEALAAGALPLGQDQATDLSGIVDRPAGNPISSDVRYAPMFIPPVWGEDSRTIYHLLGDGGATYLVRYSVPPLSGAPALGPAGREIPPPVRLAGDPGRVVSGLDYAAGRLVYQAGTPTQPDELYSAAADTPAVETRLTHCNDALLAEVAVAAAEKRTFRGADGWEIEGWLMRPAEARGDGPYPTVLYIHGGPHGVYGSCFMFQCQVMASAGFAVVYTNPRGSQSYGQDFARAVVGDWGGKDYQDIMAGMDDAIACGVADPGRLGVTGWSYGGYMTSWTISQTDRFRAAVAGAIIYNRHNFWGTSDIGYNFGDHHFGGTPWEQAERLLSRSAAAYTGKVVTPLLLIHGESDLRCPIEQTEQFFLSLRFLGKTAVMVRYPGEYHSFQKPGHKADRFARSLAWFEHYLLQ
ncbi:MAG: S9 family peptidase, partial [Bacillota bacterium]|nr:S9 family peptidase [Bacillota bacterium]